MYKSIFKGIFAVKCFFGYFAILKSIFRRFLMHLNPNVTYNINVRDLKKKYGRISIENVCVPVEKLKRLRVLMYTNSRSIYDINQNSGFVAFTNYHRLQMEIGE